MKPQIRQLEPVVRAARMERAGLGTDFIVHPPRALATSLSGAHVATHVQVVNPGRATGTVVFLPALPGVETHESIACLLAEAYGIAASHPEPPWVDEYELPDEVSYRAAVEGTRVAIAALEVQQGEQQTAWDHARRFRGLLFEQGEDALEPLVWEALELLGGTVTPPNKRGEDDGRVVDPEGRQYVLEIKGRRGSMKKGDATQAANHVVAARSDSDGSEIHGLFVANAYCMDPLTERKADPFEPNGMTAVKNNSLRVVKTSQLYQALKRLQEGALDTGAFWLTLHAASPVAELPEPQQPESAS